MNIKSKLKLLIGLLTVGLICAALLVYTNLQAATINSSSATLKFSRYAIGSEYSGIIVNQYVKAGDVITTGEPLFVLSSDTLKDRLASGQTRSADLNYKLTKKNELTISAIKGGVLGNVAYSQGSFVSAGNTIATVNDTAAAEANGQFYLSSVEYSKLQPNTPIIVTLAGNKEIKSTIKGISQRSKDGKTVTIVSTNLTKLDTDQTVYNDETPISMTLTLNQNTYYSRLKSFAQAHGF